MPDMNFDCPHCGQNLDAPEDMVGMEIACPACGEGIIISDGAEAPNAPPEGLGEGPMPDDLQKSSTMKLEVPSSAMPPPPRRRIVKIKRLKK